MRFPLISLAWDQLTQGTAAMLDLALPPVCRLCGDPVEQDEDFCAECEVALSHTEPMMRRACPRCGFPQPRLRPATPPADAAAEPIGAAEPPCAVCRRVTFHFDAVVPMWIYRERVRDAVVAAKFAHRSPLGDALGRRLGGRVREAVGADPPELVTFVPSHLMRQLGRGGVGTEVQAQAVAGVLGVPCRSLLKTRRRIAKQAWLDDQSRVKNVRDAFVLKRGYAFARPPKIANHHILLVEDVLTTGATANEVSRVLRAAGARRVTLAVVARAIRHD